MSEIVLSLEHSPLGCGEVIARYDLSEIQEKAYQQGARDFAEALRVNFDLLAWNNSDEVIDYTLKEMQKGAENEHNNVSSSTVDVKKDNSNMC